MSFASMARAFLQVEILLACGADATIVSLQDPFVIVVVSQSLQRPRVFVGLCNIFMVAVMGCNLQFSSITQGETALLRARTIRGRTAMANVASQE